MLIDREREYKEREPLRDALERDRQPSPPNHWDTTVSAGIAIIAGAALIAIITWLGLWEIIFGIAVMAALAIAVIDRAGYHAHQRAIGREHWRRHW